MSNTYPMTVRFTVTDDDIAKGIPSLCSACPVYHALVRATGDKGMRAGRITSAIVREDPEYYSETVEGMAQTPALIGDWMRQFDHEEEVYPFSGWMTFEKYRR